MIIKYLDDIHTDSMNMIINLEVRGMIVGEFYMFRS